MNSRRTAPDFLKAAAAHMEARAKEYDQPGGERSIPKVVTAFNAITGHTMTEAEGWLFMRLLKDVRLFANKKGFHKDSAEDGIAYGSLMAEAKMNEGETVDATRSSENSSPRLLRRDSPSKSHDDTAV